MGFSMVLSTVNDMKKKIRYDKGWKEEFLNVQLYFGRF